MSVKLKNYESITFSIVRTNSIAQADEYKRYTGMYEKISLLIMIRTNFFDGWYFSFLLYCHVIGYIENIDLKIESKRYFFPHFS